MVATAGATAGEALSAAVEAMSAAGVEDARLAAELLLAEAGGWERAALFADPAAEIPPPAARRFGELVRRRLRREPVAYILGRKGFRRLELAVDRRVLIPRPETELLVELSLELRPRRLLDVGTGSGAIALAVADELPECEVTATDTSPGALQVARANAERLGLVDCVSFLAGTLPDDREASGGHELVLANLPYVAERDWTSLQPEVTRWEPREALLAGPDGLDSYRYFIPLCGRAFARDPGRSSTTLAVEVGEGQAPAVTELFREAGFAGIEARRDLAGTERVVLGRAGGAG